MTASTPSLPTDVHGYGAIGSRPAAGLVGREYHDSGTGTRYRDNGTSWDALTFTAASVLTVEELDGSPTDSAISKIVFPNGTLGIVGHVATYTPAGASVASSFLGYNTAGGSTQAMTAQRVYCTQIVAGASGNVLLGIQAYLDQTVEAVLALGWFLHADSGSDTIGDLLVAKLTSNIVMAHSTGGGISYPARWFGEAMGYPLTASTKYWIGVTYHSGGGAPRLYYDGSGSDRYYAGGVTPYYNDGAYNTGAQTNTTHKHSLRALVI